MITEKHNFALKYVSKTEVELLENVVYESIMDVPFDGVGFESEGAREIYMEANGLPFRGTKPAHEVINNVADLTAYAADNGIGVSGTLEEIRAQIEKHNEIQ